MARRHPLLVALAPVAAAVGGSLIAPSRLHDGDIPLEWDGAVVGGFRLPTRAVDLDRIVAGVERELGAGLGDLSREAKQQAVRMLEEQGAFELRHSIDHVADALGVSRITVYNYLNAIRAS